METSLTIQCGIVALTKLKQQFLNDEYEKLQYFLQTGEDLGLHSANKQQARRFYKVVKKGKEYPLSIRNDLLKIKRVGNKVSEYWAKIPVKATRKLWVAIKLHRSFPEKYKVCESKLYRRDNRFYLNVAIKFEVSITTSFHKLLAVDLGERTIASTVLLCNGKISHPRFYGKTARGIRRHYAWLRKRLGEKKALKTIKKVGHTERRKVNAILHKISKAIVEEAKRENAIIVIGNLHGIRDRARGKGKRFNRIVSNMPFHRLSMMIEYKAIQQGILVVSTSEAYTSQTCHVCGCDGNRKTQGLFVCPYHGEYNADLNGAINIGKKFERDLGYMPLSGVACEPTLNSECYISEKPSLPCRMVVHILKSMVIV
ncbi:transposase [Candidatus Bathyarchaeota archaeon]|nr:transposase [Candidatus Bathyarchaeota archaeon]